MKFLRVSACTFLILTISSLDAKPKTAPGLVVEEYPRHDSQTSTDSTFLEPGKFGEPIGKPYLIESLTRWKHGEDRNAIASGLLKVEESGTYHFRTDSFYDRNLLRVDGETVCEFRDGTTASSSIDLKEGNVPIEAVGYVNGRGEQAGILIEWKPPGQREFGPIPSEALLHKKREGVAKHSPYEPRPEELEPMEPQPLSVSEDGLVARELTIVAKDFVIEIYHNGRRLQRDERTMILDRFGATAEKADIDVKAGDWLVFHVANNRLRHGGSKYFAVTGQLDDERIGIITQADSENWSACDHPALAKDFIHFREAGTESRVVEIEREWEEGDSFMEKFTERRFRGDAIWGTAPSTWIKYCVPEELNPGEVTSESVEGEIGKIVIKGGRTESGVIRRPVD